MAAAESPETGFAEITFSYWEQHGSQADFVWKGIYRQESADSRREIHIDELKRRPSQFVARALTTDGSG